MHAGLQDPPRRTQATFTYTSLAEKRREHPLTFLQYYIVFRSIYKYIDLYVCLDILTYF